MVYPGFRRRLRGRASQPIIQSFFQTLYENTETSGREGALVPVPPKSADAHAKLCTINFVSFLCFIRNQNIRTPIRIDLKSIGIQQAYRKH